MIDQGIHIVAGTLGDGKTLRAAQIAEWFLKRERRVVTNINFNIEYLCKPDCDKVLVTRIPDKPTIEHLQEIGLGSDKQGEFGLLILDELGMWFNARSFQDKDRLSLIKFIIHLRKYRWIAVFICQKPSQIDKQVRDIGSMIHQCRSTKKIFWLKWLPRIHFCSMRTTFGVNAGSDIYRGQHLFGAYDTEQVFSDSTEIKFLRDDPDYLKTSKSLNGYYQLLPPTRLSPAQTAEARDKQSDLDKKLLKNSAIALAVVMCIFLWWPDRSNSEAQSNESAPVEPIITNEVSLPGQPSVTPESTRNYSYSDYRISSYNRIGDNVWYHFIDPEGNTVRSSSLENSGYKVQNRGPTEALVIGPNYEYWSIYK